MVSATTPVNLLGVAPSSNIMQLPQLGGMSFSITNNAGWYDQIQFTQSLSSTAPLDISGINFHAELRTAVGDPTNRLNMSSTATPAQFVVGGTNGILFFSVDVTLTINLSPMPYVMDILAVDAASGMVRNLCEGGPINVTVIEGVTR